jgi:hypothetical protein
MAVKTEDRVRSVLARAGEELSEKAWTIGRDKKAEQRKRLVWGIVQGAVGAAFTIGSRRIVAKAWGVLTGERPPTKR